MRLTRSRAPAASLEARAAAFSREWGSDPRFASFIARVSPTSSPIHTMLKGWNAMMLPDRGRDRSGACARADRSRNRSVGDRRVVRVARRLATDSGAAAGLALLERGSDIDASAYPYVFLVRGTLLGELG